MICGWESYVSFLKRSLHRVFDSGSGHLFTVNSPRRRSLLMIAELIRSGFLSESALY